MLVFSLKEDKIKWLFIYLIAMIVIEFSSNITARIFGNNLFLSHIYYCVHGGILSYFFLKTDLNHQQKKIIKYLSILIFSIIIVQYISTPEIFMKFNPLEVVLVNYLLILGALFYFYTTLGKKRRLFFISVAILVYSVVDLSILAFGNLLAKFDFEIVENIWIIREILLLFYYTMFLLQWKILYNGKLNLLEWKR